MPSKATQFYCMSIMTLIIMCLSQAGFCSQKKIDSIEQNLTQKLTTSRDTNRINLLLAIGAHILDHDIVSAADYKRAFPYCNEALELSLQQKFARGEGKSYLILSKIFYGQDNTKKALRFAETALKIFEKEKLMDYQADAYYQLGYYYGIVATTILKAENYFSSAVKILNHTDPHSKRMADALSGSSYLHQFLNKKELAFKENYQALKLYQEFHSPEVYRIYANLSYLFGSAGNFKLAFDYIFKALQIAETAKDNDAVFDVYTSISLLYEQTNQPLKSIEYLEEAKRLIAPLHNNNEELFLYGKLVSDYTTIHNYAKAKVLLAEGFAINARNDEMYKMLYVYAAELYLSMQRYSAAEGYYPQMMETIKGLPIYYYICTKTHFLAIRLFLETHQFAKARMHLQILDQLRKTTADPLDIAKLEMFSFRVDSAQGNFQSAIKHFQRFKNLNDSITKRSHTDQIAQIEVLYQLDKKNQDIKLKQKDIKLLTRQANLKEEALQSETKARYFLIFGLLLAGISITLLINRMRLQQHSNKELSYQKDEISSKNEILSNLVSEREWLLKEVHHRVKNNLQIVISLLNSQLSYIDQPNIREVILSSQRRMHSISLIHQEIYQNENLSGINMNVYISSLVTYITESFDLDDNVMLKLDIEALRLDVSQGVSLGLIINEAVTNSIKYAFYGLPKPWMINIKLRKAGEKQLELTIADNGRGMPDHTDVNSHNSLGMKLIKGLTKQLKGEVQFLSDQGLTIIVTITKLKPLTPHINLASDDQPANHSSF